MFTWPGAPTSKKLCGVWWWVKSVPLWTSAFGFKEYEVNQIYVWENLFITNYLRAFEQKRRETHTNCYPYFAMLHLKHNKILIFFLFSTKVYLVKKITIRKCATHILFLNADLIPYFGWFGQFSTQHFKHCPH